MINDRIWKLVAKKLSGEASEKELQELEEIIRANPSAQYNIEIFSRLWETKNIKESSNVDPGKLWKKIKEIDQPPAFHTYHKQRTPLFKRNLMLKNHLKIAWRHLARGKGYSVIKILGLAIGMAGAMLILLWIQLEVSYDRFHSKKDRIYKAYSRGEYEGKVIAWSGTSMLLGPVLKTEFPEVEETARFNNVSAFIFHAGDKHLESFGGITDSGFLKIFDFPLLQGNINTALNSPRSLVITKSFAQKLFGNENAMGKLVRVDSSSNFIVTGVLKDLPPNTQYNFEYLLPWSYMNEVHWDRPEWETSYVETTVLLREGVKRSVLDVRLMNVVKSHTNNVDNEIFLHPITLWHLWSKFENGKLSGGFISDIRLFAIIAGFILLIACINYMNLSTAKSVKRAREVGIRKVAGAGKTSLVRQFIGESLLVSFIAGGIGLLLVEPNLVWFNYLLEKQITVPYGNLNFWLYFIGFILLTGILSGSYPAFYLSAFKPIKVLKGTFKSVNALVTPRKALVVLQFTFAITFIICTIVIYRQIRYGQKRDLGFKQDHLVFTYMKGDARKNYDLIRSELMNSGAITSMTRTNSPLVHIWNGDNSYEWAGKRQDQHLDAAVFHTDKEFVQTMGLKLVSGRDIDAATFPTDSNAIMINETAAKMMGFKDPINQPVKSKEGNWHIVGVVKNFLPDAPFTPEFPIVIQGPGEQHWYGTISYRLNPERPVASGLKTISSVFKKYNPDYPFLYYFADEVVAGKFLSEKRTATLASIFAGLTIFISCLGLFALAAYMAENRTKEIGVRKVLGASVSTISTLLSKDFLKLVMIAFLIASPIAWWAMNKWLQDYAYHVKIDVWVFILTGVISLLLALLTVSYQSIKAALAIPVKSLRSE